MFGIGMQELAVILVIALLVFGPKRLPELARSLGRGLAEFRRASNDLRHSLSEAVEEPRPQRPTGGARTQPPHEGAGPPEGREPGETSAASETGEPLEAAGAAEGKRPREPAGG